MRNHNGIFREYANEKTIDLTGGVFLKRKDIQIFDDRQCELKVRQ